MMSSSLAICAIVQMLLQRFPPPPGMQPGSNARADMLRRLTAGGAAGLTACTLVLLFSLFPLVCVVGRRVHHPYAVRHSCSFFGRGLQLHFLLSLGGKPRLPEALRADQNCKSLLKLWYDAGISLGPGADAPISADQVAVLHRHSTCAAHHRQGRGRSRPLPRLGRHAAAGHAKPGHQLHSLRHPALPLAGPVRPGVKHGEPARNSCTVQRL